jgi:hypothetical protein
MGDAKSDGTERRAGGSGAKGAGPGPGRADGGVGAWVCWGLLWSGRAVATLLAIFWGVFFLEHLSEWYVQRGTAAFPPAWVTVVMVAHFGMIVGLLALVRWRLVGAIVTVAATATFFYPTLVHAKPAWLVLVNMAPVALIALASLRRPRP